jgi:putative transposase
VNGNEPVDARVRLAISQWPDDAPRGSVTAFCAEHEISRKSFYVLLKRAREDGQAAVLEPRSRRPKNSPSRIPDEVKEQAVGVRAVLEASGLDHGPISVHDKMKTMGFARVPSVASLARIFRETGVARLEPKKKPRSAYRRFVYPAPNACWQLDATEYVLAGGRKCVIFQLQDDHSRVAVTSHVADGETSEAALVVFKKGVAARGVPQRLLTDNGAALNPTRRGAEGQLVTYATSLGVEPMTGKPGKPTTQGKNERFHRTLFRWLDKQPIAETIAGLQSLVDEFDRIYNTERPHQALPGRVTPQQAWERTPVADPPLPKPAPRMEWTRKVPPSGGVTIRNVEYQIGKQYAGEHVHVIADDGRISFSSPRTGEVLIEHPLPAPGVRYVGNGRPSGPRPKPTPSPIS